jgi:hypothetical protein
VRHRLLPGQVVSASDLHDPLVVPVSLQQFFAKGKKTRIRQAIVFEDDSLLHMIEDPGDLELELVDADAAGA